jgi:hypothetical protein
MPTSATATAAAATATATAETGLQLFRANAERNINNDQTIIEKSKRKKEFVIVDASP